MYKTPSFSYSAISALRIFSEVNPWMDCVVLVASNNIDEASDIVREAFDWWNEEGEDECYGDAIQDALTRADIPYTIYYHDDEDESPEYEEKWEAFVADFDPVII